MSPASQNWLSHACALRNDRWRTMFSRCLNLGSRLDRTLFSCRSVPHSLRSCRRHDHARSNTCCRTLPSTTPDRAKNPETSLRDHVASNGQRTPCNRATLPLGRRRRRRDESTPLSGRSPPPPPGQRPRRPSLPDLQGHLGGSTSQGPCAVSAGLSVSQSQRLKHRDSAWSIPVSVKSFAHLPQWDARQARRVPCRQPEAGNPAQFRERPQAEAGHRVRRSFVLQDRGRPQPNHPNRQEPRQWIPQP